MEVAVFVSVGRVTFACDGLVSAGLTSVISSLTGSSGGSRPSLWQSRLFHGHEFLLPELHQGPGEELSADY